MLRTALLVLAWTGCGYAHVITRTPTGGVIELDGDHGRAQEEADQQMADQCGINNFTITKEADELGAGPKPKRRVYYTCGNPPPVAASGS